MRGANGGRPQNERALEQIPALTAKGLSASQIAVRLGISARQVQRYRQGRASGGGDTSGVCPVCTRTRQLRIDGTLRSHGWTSGRAGNCPGSLHTPSNPIEVAPSTAPVTWDDARCRDYDPEMFFDKNPLPAKRICVGCSLRTQCLEWSWAINADDGVFGGYDGAERKTLKRRRDRAAS